MIIDNRVGEMRLAMLIILASLCNFRKVHHYTLLDIIPAYNAKLYYLKRFHKNSTNGMFV